MKHAILSILLRSAGHLLTAQIMFVKTTVDCPHKSNATMWIGIHEDTANEYPDEYLLELENITTGEYWEILTELYNTIEINNLSAGDYEITIRLPENCRLYREKTLPASEVTNISLSASLLEPGCNMSNGSIYIFPSGGAPLYRFEWSDGVVQNAHSASRNLLSEGEYCVTVTDQECGYATGCYTIVEPAGPLAIEVDFENLDDCENGVSADCEGFVDLTISGEGTYSVQWNGPGGFTANTEDISGLCTPGWYSYSISYHPSCPPYSAGWEIICCNSVSNPLSASMETDWDCMEMGTLAVVISGGLPPYSILWSTGDTSLQIESLSGQEYSVTVTDMRGCKMILDHHFSVIEIIDEIPACQGIFDGAITLRIHNPNNYPVDVNYDFAPCFDCFPFPLIVDDTNSVITIYLSELAGDSLYTFYVYMDGCSIPFTFILDEDPFERENIGFYEANDDEYYCYYDLTCGETTIDTGEISLAFVDLNEDVCDPGNPFSKCGSVDYYCQHKPEPIASKDVRRKAMRRLEAVLLARSLGISEEAIAFHLQGNACDRVVVCPNNPLCGNLSFLGEFAGRFGGYQDLGNGCTRVRCRLFGVFGIFSYTICGLDFIPSYIRPYFDDDPGFFSRCSPVTRDVASMVYYLPELIDEHGSAFLESTLYDFLVAHQFSQERFCAKVTYCQDDFSFVTSDIDEINCEIIDPPVNDGGYLIGATCQPIAEPHGGHTGWYVWCYRDCIGGSGQRDCLEPRYISLDRTCCFLTSEDTIIPPLFIYGMPSGTTFKAFAPLVQEENGRSMNALLLDGMNSRYHLFGLSSARPVPVDSLVYLFQNLPENAFFMMQNDTSGSSVVRILAGDIGEPDEFAFSSDSLLSIEAVYTHEDVHYVFGSFARSLQYSEVPIGSSNVLCDFILETDLNGSLLEINIITTQGTAKVLTDQFPGQFYVVTTSNASISYEGSSSSSYSIGDIIEVDISQSGVVATKRLATGNSFELLRFAYDSTSNTKYYLLSGRGDISIGSHQVYSGSQDKLVILATIDDQFAWVKTLDNSVVRTDYIALEASIDGDCFLGLNLLDSLVIADSTYRSAGGSDVLLLGYDSAGDVFFVQQSGSVDSEIIMDIYYSEGLLYLGGDMLGSESIRRIGNLDFVKFPKDQDHAFVSVAVVESASTSEGSFTTSSEYQEKESENKLFVYPNPTKDKIFVRQPLYQQYFRIEIFDAFGRRVNIINPARGGLDAIEIPTSTLPTGVYFIVATDERNMKFSTAFTKID